VQRAGGRAFLGRAGWRSLRTRQLERELWCRACAPPRPQDPGNVGRPYPFPARPPRPCRRPRQPAKPLRRPPQRQDHLHRPRFRWPALPIVAALSPWRAGPRQTPGGGAENFFGGRAKTGAAKTNFSMA
jgi:hypothetical protein